MVSQFFEHSFLKGLILSVVVLKLFDYRRSISWCIRSPHQHTAATQCRGSKELFHEVELKTGSTHCILYSMLRWHTTTTYYCTVHNALCLPNSSTHCTTNNEHNAIEFSSEMSQRKKYINFTL